MTGPADERCAALFEFGGSRIVLDPMPAAHLQWLREFLTPAFALHRVAGGDGGARGGGSAPRISLRIDANRSRELLAAGADGGEVDAFVLDSGVVRLPTWRHHKGPAVFDESTQVFYIVDGHHTIVLSAVDRPAVRIALMRVIRELASNHAVDRGALLLHAAAFAINGRAVIVAGPKRAGKTTLLLQALETGQATYLGNDRVVISPSTNGPTARGMPTIVSIRASSLPLLPALTERLTRHCYHFRSTLAEVHAVEQNAKPAAVDPVSRQTLTPAQLCELTTSRAVAWAPASLLLFPQFDGARELPRLTEIGHDEATGLLNASLLGSNPMAANPTRTHPVGTSRPPRHSLLFQWPCESVPFATAKRMPVISEIPAYRYHPSTGDHAMRVNLAAIIERLPQRHRR